MVAKVKVLPYQCEVCNKTYSTQKQAEKCEDSHEEIKQKKAQEKADRIKLHDRLVEIRTTAESWGELQEKALIELKQWYGDDFVLELPPCMEGWDSKYRRARCTYSPCRKVMSGDYFSDGGAGYISAMRLLKTLGFTTHGGGGDGKIYSYSVSYDVADFPAIEKKISERTCAVEEVVDTLRLKAVDYYHRMKEDSTLIALNEQCLNLTIQIGILQDQLQHCESTRERHISEIYKEPYLNESDIIVKALPQEFKKEVSDPIPSYYFIEYEGV